MKTCGTCGTQIREDAAFCPRCGTKLTQAPVAPAANGGQQPVAPAANSGQQPVAQNPAPANGGYRAPMPSAPQNPYNQAPAYPNYQPANRPVQYQNYPMPGLNQPQSGKPGLVFALVALGVAVLNIILHFVPMVRIGFDRKFSMFGLLDATDGLLGLFDSDDQAIVQAVKIGGIFAVVLIGLFMLLPLIPVLTGKRVSAGYFVPLILSILLSFLIQVGVFIFLIAAMDEYHALDALHVEAGLIFYILSALSAPIVVGVCAGKASAASKKAAMLSMRPM